jgi:hypothetical protein
MDSAEIHSILGDDNWTIYESYWILGVVTIRRVMVFNSYCINILTIVPWVYVLR